MTALDAAYQVLKADGKPMHYGVLTARILEQGLWSTSGKTPPATVNSLLAVDIKNNGGASRFKRVGKGVFALNEAAPTTAAATPKAKRRSAAQAALIVLQDAGGPLHYKELTSRMLKRGLWASSGKTPHETVSSRIGDDIRKKGARSRFLGLGKGLYALRETSAGMGPDKGTAPPEQVPKSKMTYLDAAERYLQEVGGGPVHYGTITAEILNRGWIKTKGTTPANTLLALIHQEATRRKKRAERLRLVNEGKGIIRLAGRDREGIPAQIDRHNRDVRKKLHARLAAMDPAAFEELVGELLAAIGFEEVEVTRAGGDGGIDVRGTLVVADVIATKMAVQVKRWKNNVQAPTVQQVRGSLGAHEQGLIITTAGFSKGARAEAARADATPVGLMDGTQLVDLLLENDIGVQRASFDMFELEMEGIPA